MYTIPCELNVVIEKGTFSSYNEKNNFAYSGIYIYLYIASIYIYTYNIYIFIYTYIFIYFYIYKIKQVKINSWLGAQYFQYFQKMAF